MADTQDLIVDLKIRDNLSVGLANAKTSLGGLDAQVAKTEGGLGHMALSLKNVVGGFLAFSAVQQGIAFLSEAGKAATDDEASIARLTAGLKANVPAWEQNSAAIEKAIAAGAKLGFADDEIRDSAVRLSAATHDLGQALAIQNTAMDLARFKGISLAEATSALVTVEAGRFRGLAQLGIVLEKGATQTEALAAVQKVAAGQAESFGKTTAGTLAEVDVAIGEIKETIGVGLVGAVHDLGGALGTLKPGFDILVGIADILLTPVKVASDTSDKVKQYAADLQKAHDLLAPDVAAQAQAFASLNAAITANQAAFAAGTITEEEYRKKAEDIDVTFARMTASTDTFTHASQDLQSHVLAVAGALSQADDQAAGWVASAKASTASTEGLSAAQLKVAQATIDAARVHADLSEAQKAAGDAAIDNTAAVVDLARAQVADADATDRLKTATDQLKATQDAVVAAQAAAITSVLNSSDAWKDYSDDLRGVDSTATQLITDLITLNGMHVEATVDVVFSTPNVEAVVNGTAAFQGIIDERLRNAKEAADAYAAAIRDKVAKSFDTAGNRADSLFDKLHARHLQAIADTEKLAEKQHSTALQAISDALKLKLDASAAPVTAAEEAQRRVELQRQRRGLGEGLQSALASGDPTAIRNAQEALQSFNAEQRIAALKLTQSKLDLAAQVEAANATKAADDKLNAAKLAQAADLDRVNAADKKRQGDFDKALAALKVRDADVSPAKSKADIKALEERFGITTDSKGFHHIDDPLVIAIKGIKIPPPVNNITVTVTSPPIFLNGRLIAAAMASSQSPTATPTVRTGALAPRP